MEFWFGIDASQVGKVRTHAWRGVVRGLLWVFVDHVGWHGCRGGYLG